jgi:hypothetical protein
MIEKKIIKYLVIGLVFFSILEIMTLISVRRETKTNFNGVIKRIDYSEKRTPTVTIKGNRYGLSTGWRFNEKMEVGDLLIKEEGTMAYKLIKNKTGEVIFSNE